MGGGGSQNATKAGNYSWAGGGSSNFSPEKMNQTMGSDILAAYKQGPTEQFDQSLYTGMGNVTGEGMGGLLDQARGSQGYMSGAMDSLGGVAAGDYLGGANPYLDDIVSQTNDSTYADVMASLGSTGRTGSNLHMESLGGALADNESRLRYGDYENERGRQVQAASMLPGMYQASLLPSQTITGVGQMQDQDAQAQRMAEFERFQRTSDPAFQHLAKYQGLLSGQAQNPQPERQPGVFDWLGLGITGASVLL